MPSHRGTSVIGEDEEGSTGASRQEQLETSRILGRYKRVVLLGRARLPLEAGRRLVGPDCAFHLYFRHADGPGTARRRRRRARGAGSRAKTSRR